MIEDLAPLFGDHGPLIGALIVAGLAIAAVFWRRFKKAAAEDGVDDWKDDISAVGKVAVGALAEAAKEAAKEGPSQPDDPGPSKKNGQKP